MFCRSKISCDGCCGELTYNFNVCMSCHRSYICEECAKNEGVAMCKKCNQKFFRSEEEDEQIVVIHGKKYRKVWRFGGQDFGSEYESMSDNEVKKEEETEESEIEESEFYCEDCDQEYTKEEYENNSKTCKDCEELKCPNCQKCGKNCDVCGDYYCEECCAPQKQVMIEFDFPKKDKIRNICYYCVVIPVRDKYVDGKYIKKQKIENV